jgi:DNA-binding IclR family transcriptional regulator
VVVVVEGAAPLSSEVSARAAATLAAELLREGGRPSAVAREVAQRFGLARNEAYEIVQGLKEEGP